MIPSLCDFSGCFQEVHHQLCTQKALLQALMEKIKVRFCPSLVPLEIQSLLQEVKQSLQVVEVKVGP